MVAKIPSPLQVAWRAMVGRLDGALDVWNTWRAWKARARAEKRLAKSQARYNVVTPQLPSTPTVTSPKTSVA